MDDEKKISRFAQCAVTVVSLMLTERFAFQEVCAPEISSIKTIVTGINAFYV